MSIKIMLDAGHYGKYNQSPVLKTYYESDMSWKLHKYLKAELEKYGFVVGVTRSNQATDLEVYQRGLKAKGYNLFISLHSNAAGDKTVDYPIAYTHFDGKMDKLGLQIAKAVGTLMGTKQVGRTSHRTYVNGGVTYDYYGVIRGAWAAGVQGIILEHSFHTNLAASKWLSVDSNLKKIAVKEAEILAAYYGLSKTSKPATETTKPAETTTNKPTASTSTTYKTGIYKVNVSSLNIRKGAGVDYAVAGTITDKGQYTITEIKNGSWGKLKSGAGWINVDKAYCSYVKSATSGTTTNTFKPYSVKVTVKDLHIRAGAGTNYASKGYCPVGTYTITEEKKANGYTWGKLKSGAGWIALEYVTKL